MKNNLENELSDLLEREGEIEALLYECRSKIRTKKEELWLRDHSVKIGDKVLIDGKEKGIFSGFKHAYGDARPLINKIKKDGGASQHTIWVSWDAKITLCDI